MITMARVAVMLALVGGVTVVSSQRVVLYRGAVLDRGLVTFHLAPFASTMRPRPPGRLSGSTYPTPLTYLLGG